MMLELILLNLLLVILKMKMHPETVLLPRRPVVQQLRNNLPLSRR